MLSTVARCGPLGLSELAEIEGLNPTMLSRVVAKLEAGALLGRAVDPNDRRASTVAITSAGDRLLVGMRSERNDTLRAELERLPAGEREALWAALPVLEKLAEQLKEVRG